MSPTARPQRLTRPERERARRVLARRDRRLAVVMRRAGECRLRSGGPPYPWLLRSILYQQLAGAAAAAIEKRFFGLFGGETPQPAELLKQSDAKLRAVGLSRQKAAAVRAVAEAMQAGAIDPRRLARLGDDDVVAELTEIRGVGDWTAHMLLMSSLARPDVLPVGDYGVRKGAQLIYGLAELPKPAELMAIAERWRPYRSVGSWYMWRFDQLEPKDLAALEKLPGPVLSEA